MKKNKSELEKIIDTQIKVERGLREMYDKKSREAIELQFKCDAKDIVLERLSQIIEEEIKNKENKTQNNIEKAGKIRERIEEKNKLLLKQLASKDLEIKKLTAEKFFVNKQLNKLNTKLDKELKENK